VLFSAEYGRRAPVRLGSVRLSLSGSAWSYSEPLTLELQPHQDLSGGDSDPAALSATYVHAGWLRSAQVATYADRQQAT
jgi:hypothetical protein